MSKLQTINDYLNVNKMMDKMLGDIRVNFRKELKSIIGITQNVIDRCSIEFENNKEKMVLIFNVDNSFLINLLTNSNENPFEDPDPDNKVYIKLAAIDLVSEVAVIVKTKYEELLEEILNSIYNENNNILKQKKILMEKNNSFFFRLFHKNVDIAISNMDFALEKINEMKRIIQEELRLFNETIETGVINTFIDEGSNGLGMVNIKKTYIDEGAEAV